MHNNCCYIRYFANIPCRFCFSMSIDVLIQLFSNYFMWSMIGRGTFMGASDFKRLNLHAQEFIYKNEDMTGNKFYHALITNYGFGEKPFENIF